MRTFLANIIPNLQQFSQQLDDLSLLTNQHWVLIDEIQQSKTVYIFRKNGELLVSRNGKVEKARWEHLGNKSILIDIQAESFLFKHSFCDENIVALKLDSKNEYALFVNENRHSEDINTAAQVVTFLQNKYLDKSIEKQVKSTLGIKSESSFSNQPAVKEVDITINNPIYFVPVDDEIIKREGYKTDSYGRARTMVTFLVVCLFCIICYFIYSDSK